MLFFGGAVLAFFLSAIIAGKKIRTISDKILSLWMFVIGTHLLFFFFETTGIAYRHTWLLGATKPFPLLHGPFLYLYVHYLTGKSNRLRNHDYLHAVPALLMYVSMLPFFITPRDERLAFIENLDANYRYFDPITILSVAISGVTYITLSLILLKRYKRAMFQYFSNTEKINLNWLRMIIRGMIAIWAVFIFFYLLEDLGGITLSFDSNVPLYATVTLLVLLMGYYGIKQVRIFSDTEVEEQLPKGKAATSASSETDRAENDRMPGLKNVQYRKSGLKPDDVAELKSKLVQLMQEKKLYLKNDLTLKLLAEELGIHPNYVSQVINGHFNQTFYQFVNSYRIEEFKEKVRNLDKKKYTLEGLAIECGFNSKSAFYDFFKQSTGKTPAEFIQQ